MSRRAQGTAFVFEPTNARPHESDTITCCHCQRIVMLHALDASGKKKTQDEIGSFCMRCMRATCSAPGCNAIGGCTPFEKQVEKSEAAGRERDRLFREIGL